MITCLIGTRAQLIKMAPIMLEMERRGIPFQFLLSGQHQETMNELLEEFGICTPSISIHEGGEITGILQMGGWFMRSLISLLRPRSPYLRFGDRARDVMVVHGDTMTTLLGAIAGRLKGMTVAHVEAGLRSFNLMHPFPEEITRLAVFRLADIAFCPGEWACANMARFDVKVIDTGCNTLRDTLERVLALDPGESVGGGYGVVSLHRFENIAHRSRLSTIIDLVERAASRTRLVFVLHPATRAKLARYGLLTRLERNPRIELRSRMGYVAFVRLLRHASFVITDGGGNQEELSYLGVPTLLMRKATERCEGLGSTVTMCRFDSSILDDFLERLSSREARLPAPSVRMSPTRIIVDALAPYAD